MISTEEVTETIRVEAEPVTPDERTLIQYELQVIKVIAVACACYLKTRHVDAPLAEKFHRGPACLA